MLYGVLYKERTVHRIKLQGHERADKLMFVTRAANSDRLPFLYGRSMTYNVLSIIDVIRNEHDEDENNSSVFSDL